MDVVSLLDIDTCPTPKHSEKCTYCFFNHLICHFHMVYFSWIPLVSTWKGRVP